MATMTATSAKAAGMTKDEKFVIFASSLGTVFEWYDFYLYATLAPFFAALFFPPGNDTAALLSAFATYAAGFLVRPFGAILFGRIGDLVGRKYTFLVTIVVMGGVDLRWSACCRHSQTIGWLAPILLVALRLASGPRARRRIWRRGNLCGRACTAERTRLCDKLHSDHGDARFLPGAAGDRALPHQHGRQGVRRMGLANSVPGFR